MYIDRYRSRYKLFISIYTYIFIFVHDDFSTSFTYYQSCGMYFPLKNHYLILFLMNIYEIDVTKYSGLLIKR